MYFPCISHVFPPADRGGPQPPSWPRPWSSRRTAPVRPLAGPGFVGFVEFWGEKSAKIHRIG